MHRFAEATHADAYAPAFSAVEDFVLAEKSSYICSLLELAGRPLPMKDFVNAGGTWEIIITFIALLEMARQRKVILLQDRLFGPILVALSEKEPQKEEPNGERTAD